MFKKRPTIQMITPSREEQLEAIRGKVIAVVPEIMDLKFGCQVKNKRGVPFTVIDNFEGRPIILTHFLLHEMPQMMDAKDEIDKGNVEILGRPIRLADILLAIGKANKDFAVCGSAADNAQYALDLYAQYGLKPWTASKGCWIVAKV
jgi:hypothetical protein